MDFRKIIFLMLAIGLCFLNNEGLANNESFRFAEKANLALRRTAHRLLLHNGDSLSTIPPVKQIDPNTFSIRMEHLFEYEELPALLKQSLQMQHIERGYNVTVLKCENGEVQLGYNFLDLDQKDGVTCGGRKQKEGCYQLQVSFVPENEGAKTASGNWWLLPFGSALAGLGLLFGIKQDTGMRSRKFSRPYPTLSMMPEYVWAHRFLIWLTRHWFPGMRRTSSLSGKQNCSHCLQNTLTRF
jgi:hypothetical protein